MADVTFLKLMLRRVSIFIPKDFGGAIVSVDGMGRDDWQSPCAYWQWAKWRGKCAATGHKYIHRRAGGFAYVGGCTV